jgi:hypothetical protein
VVGREQGELVEGKRPGDASGEREHDLPDDATVEVAEHSCDPRDVYFPPEGESAGDGLAGPGARRDEERVIVDRRVAPGSDSVPIRIDGDQ